MSDIDGAEGNDVLNGTGEPDTINGLDGKDIIGGIGDGAIASDGAGDDNFDVSYGASSVSGDGGDDVIHLKGTVR